VRGRAGDWWQEDLQDEGEIVIEGKIQKPEAFYVLQKSGINYDWNELRQELCQDPGQRDESTVLIELTTEEPANGDPDSGENTQAASHLHRSKGTDTAHRQSSKAGGHH